MKGVIRVYPHHWKTCTMLTECMKLTGLVCNTYYKYKRQIREEQEAAKSMRQME